MGNKAAAFEKGVGSLHSVATHYAQQPDMTPGISIAIDGLYKLRHIMSDLPTSRRKIMAHIAALLNEDYGETGWMWSVRDDGTMTRDYTSDKAIREIMADLMAD